MSDTLAPPEDDVVAVPLAEFWVSPAAAAAMAGTSERTIYRHIASGQLAARHAKKRTLVNLSQVVAGLEPKEN